MVVGGLCKRRVVCRHSSRPPLPAKSAFLLFTHRPLSSSFLGLPIRILNGNHKKELLRGLWAGLKGSGVDFSTPRMLKAALLGEDVGGRFLQSPLDTSFGISASCRHVACACE